MVSGGTRSRSVAMSSKPATQRSLGHADADVAEGGDGADGHHVVDGEHAGFAAPLGGELGGHGVFTVAGERAVDHTHISVGDASFGQSGAGSRAADRGP